MKYLVHVAAFDDVKLHTKNMNASQQKSYCIERGVGCKTVSDSQIHDQTSLRFLCKTTSCCQFLCSVCCSVRILCHNTTSIVLSEQQHIQQPKDSQADGSKEDRTDTHLCGSFFLLEQTFCLYLYVDIISDSLHVYISCKWSSATRCSGCSVSARKRKCGVCGSFYDCGKRSRIREKELSLGRLILLVTAGR